MLGSLWVRIPRAPKSLEKGVAAEILAQSEKVVELLAGHEAGDTLNPLSIAWRQLVEGSGE